MSPGGRRAARAKRRHWMAEARHSKQRFHETLDRSWLELMLVQIRTARAYSRNVWRK